MAGEIENRMLAMGARKQSASGAWLFPEHPQEKARRNTMKELETELDEVRKLKEELLELKDNLTSE